MSDTPSGTTPGRSFAERRFADGLVRFLGGAQITLRLADPATGDTANQLGLEPPPAEDLQLSPVVIRDLPAASNGKRRMEVLFSASTIRPLAKSHGIEDIAAWLLAAEGILCFEHLLHVEAVAVDKVLGADCLFHITATE